MSAKHAAAVAALEAAGASKIHTARIGRNHVVVSFELKGVAGSLLLAGTPGDRRRQLAQTHSTARSALRRLRRGA
jgi:hypothetical protein